jgi:hypothetical protein
MDLDLRKEVWAGEIVENVSGTCMTVYTKMSVAHM